MINSSEILSYLKSKSSNQTFVDRLKIRYRPLICPFDLLLNFVTINDSVADIGCGSGQFCALVAKFTPATKIYGIEISKKLVANAKELNKEFKDSKEIKFSRFDGNIIPIEISNYTKVYLIDVLHHVPKKNQEAFLTEIYSKMAIGSQLILKDIDANNPLVFFNKIHDVVFSREIGNEISADSAKEILDKVGFNLLASFKKRLFVYPHYFLILQK